MLGTWSRHAASSKSKYDATPSPHRSSQKTDISKIREEGCVDLATEYDESNPTSIHSPNHSMGARESKIKSSFKGSKLNVTSYFPTEPMASHRPRFDILKYTPEKTKSHLSAAEEHQRSQIAKLLLADTLLSDNFLFCDPRACQSIIPEIPPLVDIEDSFNPYAKKSNSLELIKSGLSYFDYTCNLQRNSSYRSEKIPEPQLHCTVSKAWQYFNAETMRAAKLDSKSETIRDVNNQVSTDTDQVKKIEQSTPEQRKKNQQKITPQPVTKIKDLSRKVVKSNAIHQIPQVCDGFSCQNCGAQSTPLWRKSLTGDVLCNACGLFERTHRRPRPPNPRAKRNNSKSESLVGFAQSSCFNTKIETTCGNCYSTKTSLWRRNNDGNIVCNACQLYRKLKGVDRPVEMKNDVVRRRKRRIKEEIGSDIEVDID